MSHRESRTTVVIHGHFYQPPREDPWTGTIPQESTASPFPNWNERITHECYAPLARSRAFKWMSFDIGPTLASWLEREHPDVHNAMLAADRASRERVGFGNALAQPFHHIILPLASAKEKRTEIRWGLRDFERRFGRPADGMWLPETAVDVPTLEALAAEAVAFTVLAPHQLVAVPSGGVGRAALPGGRSIDICTYDGELSHGMAFGALLQGGSEWFNALEARAQDGPEWIALAADGETFGHHHPGSERVLMGVLQRIANTPGFEVGNFSSVLERARVRRSGLEEVQIHEPSAWSCAHGVDRWRTECGCKAAPERAWRQTWRGHLRDALETLAKGLDEAWSKLAPGFLRDPEATFEHLGEVLGGPGTIAGLAEQTAFQGRYDAARALIEIQRDRAAMFTSCAWFFDDVAGVEGTLVVRYAAHALSRLKGIAPEVGQELEREFMDRLRDAESNDPDIRDASVVYRGVCRAVA